MSHVEAAWAQAIAQELAWVRDQLEPCTCLEDYCSCFCDVRLQVYDLDEPTWSVRYGPSDYDQDHRGFWGAASINGSDDDDALMDVARELLDQALDHAAQCGGEESSDG